MISLNTVSLYGLKNISGPQSERIKKDFQKIFPNHGFEIVIDSNVKIVDYPAQPNKRNIQIIPQTRQHHKLHPHPIKAPSKHYQTNPNRHREILPFFEEVFKYQGYNHAFSYNPTPPNDNNQNKKQWHNSSFDKNVSTNIGKNFLYIIRKHFPRIFKVPLNFQQKHRESELRLYVESQINYQFTQQRSWTQPTTRKNM